MSQETGIPVHSSFRLGRIEVKYYLREPSPGTWNAIGVIYFDQEIMSTMNRCPMVVGVGTTCHEAVGDLLARVLGGDHPDLPQAALQEQASLHSGTSETTLGVASELLERDRIPASR